MTSSAESYALVSCWAEPTKRSKSRRTSDKPNRIPTKKTLSDQPAQAATRLVFAAVLGRIGGVAYSFGECSNLLGKGLDQFKCLAMPFG